jgi:hypothetical protein
MTDAEFLAYCEAHAETPRCGFTPAHIARLCRLAGRDEAAKRWEGHPPGVINCVESEVLEVVAEGRSRLALLPVS